MKTGTIVLAVVGGITLACLLGWAIAHPMMVLHRLAHVVAENGDAREQWPLDVNAEWDSPPVGQTFDVTIDVGVAPWFDKIAYAHGLEPLVDIYWEWGHRETNSWTTYRWDLRTVMEAITKEP